MFVVVLLDEMRGLMAATLRRADNVLIDGDSDGPGQTAVASRRRSTRTEE